MADVSKRLSLPTVVIPVISHFDEAPPWTGEPNRNYCFVEVNRRDQAKTPIRFIEFKPDVNVLLFGLDPASSHVFVGHPSVSPQHAFAAFHKANGMCFLQDLESANGTFIDDAGVDHSKAHEVYPNQRIRFGLSTHEFIFIQAPEHLRKGVPPYKPSGPLSLDAMTESSVPPTGKISPQAIRPRPGDSSPGGASSEAFVGPTGPPGPLPAPFPPRPGGSFPPPPLDAPRRDYFDRPPQPPLDGSRRASFERPSTAGEDHGPMPRRIDDRSPRGRNELRRGSDARSSPRLPPPPYQDRVHRLPPHNDPENMGRFEGGRSGHGPEGFSPRRGGHGPEGFSPRRGGHGPESFSPRRGGHTPEGISPRRGAHGPEGFSPRRGAHGPEGFSPRRGGHGPEGFSPRRGGHAPEGFSPRRGGHAPEGFSPRRGGPHRWRNDREAEFGERPPHDISPHGGQPQPPFGRGHPNDDFPRPIERGPISDRRGDPARIQGGHRGPENEDEHFPRGSRRDPSRGGRPGGPPGRNFRRRVSDEQDHRDEHDHRERNHDNWDDHTGRGRGQGRGMMQGHGRGGNDYNRDNGFQRDNGYDREDRFNPIPNRGRGADRGRGMSRGRGNGAGRHDWDGDNFDHPRGRPRGGSYRGNDHYD